MQCNAIQYKYNTIQYNTIQIQYKYKYKYNTNTKKKTQHNTTQYNTTQHDANIHINWTGLWSGHAVASNDSTHSFFDRHVRIGCGAKRKHLPHQHTVRPHIACARVFGLKEAFGRQPTGWDLSQHNESISVTTCNSKHKNMLVQPYRSLGGLAVVRGGNQGARHANITQLDALQSGCGHKHIPVWK